MTQKSIKIGDFLLRKKDIITVQDGEKYKRITIRMNKLGVLQRDEVMGVDIGTKKQYIVKGGEFIISKIDARNGAFGIVPESLKGAIITGDFLAYDINTELVDMDFFLAFISLNNFEKICAQASSGTTNRQRLSEPKFLNFEIQIPETLGEQKEMMEKYREYKKGFSELKNLSERNEKLIKSLKSSILQDAIQGKLVPQDLSDESASILIERIQTEKTKLISEGKLKKQKPLAPIKPEEIPYELPKGWEWVRLGEILKYIQRGPSAKYSEKSNIGIINQKCIQWRGLELDHIKYYSTELIEKLNEDRYLGEDDILLNSTGTGTIGRCILLDELPLKSYIADSHVTILRSSISQKYLLSFLSSQGIQNFFNNGGVFGTTNQIELSSSAIQNFLFPLPPINEQVRIVEKVDELMKSCEFLDGQVKEAKERSEKLMESVLQGVLNG